MDLRPAILLLCALLCAPAGADDCSHVRLDEVDAQGHPGSMVGVSPYDETDLDICFSIVATQLGTASLPPEARPTVSGSTAFVGALGFLTEYPEAGKLLASNQDHNDGSLDRRWLFEGNGLVCPTFRALQAGGGACRSDLHVNTENLAAEIDAWTALQGSTVYAEDARGAFTSLARFLDTHALRCGESDAAGSRADLPFDALLNLLDRRQDADLGAARKILAASCAPAHRAPIAPELKCRSANADGVRLTRSRTRELLDRSLTSGPGALPPTIAYCSAFLYDGKDSQGRCNQHLSLVIGRDLIEGKCKYLVRNSVGTSCNSYHPDWFHGCEEGKGNVWVDADALDRQVYDVITVGKDEQP